MHSHPREPHDLVLSHLETSGLQQSACVCLGRWEIVPAGLLQILRGEFGLLQGRLVDVEGPAAAARLLGVRVGEEEAAADDLARCIAFCIRELQRFA